MSAGLFQQVAITTGSGIDFTNARDNIDTHDCTAAMSAIATY